MDEQVVKIVAPSAQQFCDGECQREACRQAIRDDTPLLCEAFSTEDMLRIENTWGLERLRQLFNAEQIYRLGLAFLVITAEHENRKRYNPEILTEAVFAFLRVGRDDPDYTKRLAVLLFSVARTQEHFNLVDLETMFGKEVVTLLKQMMPAEGEKWETPAYYARLKNDPQTLPLLLAFYRAKLDWFTLITQDKPLEAPIKKWRKALTYLA